MNSESLFRLARVWHAKGAAAQAITAYRQVLAGNPGHLPAALFLGSLLQDHMRHDEAVEIYRTSLSHHPADVRLSDLLSRLDMPDQAVCWESLDEPIVFPHIDPVGPGPRPKWSVMITAYRRTEYLEQALRGVLSQAPGADEMQIEVLCDGPDDPMQVEIEGMVRAITTDRITFHRCPVRHGHPEIFNLCVQRARGQWVHILHDDDWVAPGFYAALERGVVEAPDVVAAFSRHTYVDEHGNSLRVSPLERESAGVVDRWLERIAWFCRLQTASMVVKREAYEQVGGYCPQAKSVFDWEMWQRLAVHGPVWYEPQPLAFFRQSSHAESSRLIASGLQIEDTRRVIGIARSYLPENLRDRLSHRACEHYAQAAFEIARRQTDGGQLESAMANIREGLRCSPSHVALKELQSALGDA